MRCPVCGLRADAVTVTTAVFDGFLQEAEVYAYGRERHLGSWRRIVKVRDGPDPKIRARFLGI